MNRIGTRASIGLTVQREVAGTPDEVFDAYTDPRKQRVWLSGLGPDEGAVQTSIDLRVGGRWEARFHPDPHTVVHDVQTFREIDRPHRVVTDLVGESSVGGEAMPTLETRIVMTFAATGTGTLVTVEQTGFPATELRDFFESTVWPAHFDRVAAFLAARHERTEAPEVVMDAPVLRPVPADASTWSPPLPGAAGFEHFIVETPGLRSHVAAIGDDDGEPIVLLHGFPQHWWQWRDIAPRLAEQGYRAICPDLRGAGWTEADDPRIRRETRLHDLVALLDALGLDRVRLVCHDMGAIAGAQLAYAHPARVASLVALSVPPPFMSFSPKMRSGLSHLPPLSLHRRGRSLDWLFTDEYSAKGFSPETVESYLAPTRRPEVDRAIGRLYRGMILPEAGRIMSGRYTKQRLHPPTLIVFGRRDLPFTEDVVRQISGDPARFADHLEFAFVEDAAHFITDDAPDAVSALALDWFERAA